jgi:dTDP-4-amino-4,6-dideoxygalactose transaminase
VEAAYAAASGLHTVWLPSARAGICWALRAATGPQTRIIGPAFTCSVVHEAMVRSGRPVELIDAATDGFGMDLPTLQAAQPEDCALVLSEPYGHTYDLAALTQQTGPRPKLRIVDTAMAVPHPSLFARLQTNDFAVISLGTGKSMFSGWGSIGFTHEAALAGEVARQRDTWLAHAGTKLALVRAAKTVLRAAAHYPLIYGTTRQLWYQAQALRRRSRRSAAAPEANPAPPENLTPEFPGAWATDQTCGAEWRLPSTYSDRRLALWNLRASTDAHATRLEQAARYQQNLAAVPGLRLPPKSAYALSHYTVRVSAECRDRMKEALRRRGVYTVSLWTFYAHLDRHKYPNAFRLSSEVINLPLSPWLKLTQVDQVCAAVRECLHHLSR